MTPHTTARERLEQAKSLLRLAEGVSETDWDLFKTLASASIVMGRSTLHLIQDQDQHQPGFKTWWHSLEGRWRTLRFFREERNALLKERLIAVHGLGYSDVAVRFRVRAEGEEVPPSEPPPPLDPAPLLTTRLAFFDAPGWDDRPAVEFIADYLTDLEAVTSEAEAQF